MADAIKSVLVGNYANFSGRARRSEFWWWVLFVFVLRAVFRVVGTTVGSGGGALAFDVVVLAIEIGLLVPSLAVGVRRLHDTRHSGWWLLIALTVVGLVVLLIWWCSDSERDNQYGPNPKGPLGWPGRSPYDGMPGHPYGG